MKLFPDIFYSVELIWLLWGVSVPVCLMLAWSLRKGEPIGWKALHREEGASYSISYVMTFPLYAMFVALVVECSLMLVTKVGTMYAAYAAARSAVVWESAKTGSGIIGAKRDEKAKRAAMLAMVPFASGSSQHVMGVPGSGTAIIPHILAAAELHRGGRFVNPNYLSRKALYASGHTKIVSIDRESDDPNANLALNLSFDAPFHIPGIGRLLGKKSLGGYYVFDIQSTASLPSESPQNNERDIGIKYLSD